MKVLIIFLSLMIFSFSFVNNIFAQERIDVVYLKNGSIIKGTIIEQIPNVSIKIETKDGSVFFYKIDEVEKMTKEKVASSNNESESEKLMMYENAKKSPLTAVALSFMLTSTGHLYADNWGRGLLFTGGRLTGSAMVLIGLNKIEVSYDEDEEITNKGKNLIYLGIGLISVLSIWEMVDAAQEVKKYNRNLYQKITGKKAPMHLSFNFKPIYNPVQNTYNLGVGMTYTF